MSRNKFAAITSSLLARKGEAAPWPNAAPPAWTPTLMTTPPPFLAPEPPIAAAQANTPPPDPDAVKKCTVRLSRRDYERLGILAVKKNLTRQQLLQAALAEVLAGMAQTCAPDCGCLNRCGG